MWCCKLKWSRWQKTLSFLILVDYCIKICTPLHYYFCCYNAVLVWITAFVASTWHWKIGVAWYSCSVEGWCNTRGTCTQIILWLGSSACTKLSKRWKLVVAVTTKFVKIAPRILSCLYTFVSHLFLLAMYNGIFLDPLFIIALCNVINIFMYSVALAIAFIWLCQTYIAISLYKNNL